MVQTTRRRRVQKSWLCLVPKYCRRYIQKQKYERRVVRSSRISTDSAASMILSNWNDIFLKIVPLVCGLTNRKNITNSGYRDKQWFQMINNSKHGGLKFDIDYASTCKLINIVLLKWKKKIIRARI